MVALPIYVFRLSAFPANETGFDLRACRKARKPPGVDQDGVYLKIIQILI
jgi:hypothetical protein